MAQEASAKAVENDPVNSGLVITKPNRYVVRNPLAADAANAARVMARE